VRKFVLSLPAVVTCTTLAEVGVVEATGAFQLPGTSSTSYISAIGAGQNPRLDGYALGSVNALTGQALLLQNWYFENYAYNGGFKPGVAATNNNWLDGTSTASLVVRIKLGMSVISINSYSLTQTGDSGNNRFWQLAPAAQGTNLTSGLANGEYSVSFYTAYNFNQWTGSVSQVSDDSAQVTAHFTIIPAPSAAALIGLAGFITSRRRK
jgi:hypothetical protein